MLALKRIYCYLNSLHIYKKQIQIELPKYEYKEKFNNKNDKIKLICFYLPQFHTFPENDNWWGKGFTEWTNVKRSRPMYVNHIQPEIPHSDIGYYIIKDTSTIKQQADLALSFGVYGFCFHYYWFSGKKIMEKVIENFLADQSIDLPFCINWANENWTRRWDGLDDQILIKQDYSVKNLKNFMLQIIPIFKDKRYIRIKDRPLFLVYRSDQIPNIKNVINMWTDLCIQNNENKPFFVMCLTNENYEFANLGFDAAVQFPPHMPWTKYRSDLPILLLALF